ncbi:hypothetical protein ANN_06445 [Periplaneta americana]|uniref:Per a allergen n=1 Tax=Periplaneta americana TaxID=6978 RepID=A0ABQ8TFA6_PERAM|nr:hypothetical protein ANN_06445 [Periplaneta americana]
MAGLCESGNEPPGSLKAKRGSEKFPHFAGDVGEENARNPLLDSPISCSSVGGRSVSLRTVRAFNERHPEENKINVWADIFGDDIVGPIFIEENLTGELYVNVSENVIDPLITLSLENQVNEGKMVLDEQNLHFQ